MKVGLHHFHDVEISCSECGATGEMFDVDDGVRNEVKYNKEGAIEAWNRRTEPDGWKLVPVEPFNEALVILQSVRDRRVSNCNAYRAMLNAAPNSK